MRIAILGLSITSSWGNGHATNYRALVRALAARGHEVLFFERDVPWYAANRDLARPPGCETRLYRSLDELRGFGGAIEQADLVLVGSYVPDGVAVGEWVLEHARGMTAFWDIDTPVTIAKLAASDTEYLSPELVAHYDLYLSFTGGPILRRLESEFGAPRAEPFYCMVDADAYCPGSSDHRWLLGYLGTYSEDRQDHVETLLVEPARRLAHRRFAVAGPQYPDAIAWPPNVERLAHLPPPAHRDFYLAQRFTLNVTRAEMRRWGWCPSVRLFEAAACGTPIVSDWWEGLDECFEPSREIFVARSADETVEILSGTSDAERRAVAEHARARVLAEHTADRRARQLESFVREAARVAA